MKAKGRCSWQPMTAGPPDLSHREKLAEYLAIGVRESWNDDRNAHTLTVYVEHGAGSRRMAFTENRVDAADLLPGYEVPRAVVRAGG
jgi:hypothetical protein